jgi:hypothetical protein
MTAKRATEQPYRKRSAWVQTDQTAINDPTTPEVKVCIIWKQSQIAFMGHIRHGDGQNGLIHLGLAASC